MADQEIRKVIYYVIDRYILYNIVASKQIQIKHFYLAPVSIILIFTKGRSISSIAVQGSPQRVSYTGYRSEILVMPLYAYVMNVNFYLLQKCLCTAALCTSGAELTLPGLLYHRDRSHERHHMLLIYVHQEGNTLILPVLGSTTTIKS